MAAKKKETPKATFEEGLEQLEGIVRRMEDGALPLEECLAAYEDGVKLHRQLMEQLTQSEKKMITLLPGSQGAMEETE